MNSMLESLPAPQAARSPSSNKNTNTNMDAVRLKDQTHQFQSMMRDISSSKSREQVQPQDMTSEKSIAEDQATHSQSSKEQQTHESLPEETASKSHEQEEKDAREDLNHGSENEIEEVDLELTEKEVAVETDLLAQLSVISYQNVPMNQSGQVAQDVRGKDTSTAGTQAKIEPLVMTDVARTVENQVPEGQTQTGEQSTQSDLQKQTGMTAPNFDASHATSMASGSFEQSLDQAGLEKIAQAKSASASVNTSDVETSSGGDVNQARLSRVMKNAMQQQGGIVTMRLSPHEMGVVRIEMEMSEGVIKAQMTTEKEVAGDWLKMQVKDLKQNLESQGYRVEKLEVTSMSASQESSTEFGKGDKEERSREFQKSFRHDSGQGQSRGRQDAEQRDRQFTPEDDDASGVNESGISFAHTIKDEIDQVSSRKDDRYLKE